MSYRLEISPLQQKAGRFIGLVRDAFLIAILDERKSGKRITQQSIAKKLDVDRAAVNRWLSGDANLTLRTIAHLAYAIDRDIVFELRNRNPKEGSNVVTLPTVEKSGKVHPRKTRIEARTLDSLAGVL